MTLEGPRRGPGARAPLFDRLFDYDPRSHEEMHPRRAHSRIEMVESIRVELSRLLNTRCAVSLDGLRGQTRTVLNYGLPDFSTLNPTTDRDRERIGLLITEAIRAYEPRLHAPHVVVEVDAVRARALRFTLYAGLLLEGLIEPVSFPLAIDVRGGPATVGTAIADTPNANSGDQPPPGQA
jgi:type VI secretion system lysozyme-like protein